MLLIPLTNLLDRFSLIFLQSAEFIETLPNLVIEAKDFSNKVHRLHKVLRVIVGGNLIQFVDDLFGADFECFVAPNKLPYALRHF